MGAGDRRPVELDEARPPPGVDQPEGVHAEALHGAEAPRQGAVRHHPHQHVGRLGHQGDEVPERVVGAGGLRHRMVRLGLERVHEVGELHGVLDEEHRDVVADDVEVTLVGVKLRREAAHVARGVGRAALAGDGREPHEHGGALARLGEERGARVLGHRLVALEEAVGRRAAGVHDPLGDPLVIEMSDLLAEDEVLQQGGPPEPGLERVLVVGDRLAEIRRQHAAAGVDTHPVERLVPGIESGAGLGARLGRGDRLGQRAAGGLQVGRLRGSALLGLPGGLPVLVGLVLVGGKGRGQGIRVLRLASRGIIVEVVLAPGWTADGRLGGGLVLACRLRLARPRRLRRSGHGCCLLIG